MYVGHHPAVVGGVLHHSMGEHQVERGVRKRKTFTIGHFEVRLKSLLSHILSRQCDRTLCNVYPGDPGASSGESDHFHTGPAPHIKYIFVFPLVKVHEVQKMVQFFKVVLIEIRKKASRPGRMRGDLKVVNMGIPIVADAFIHARHTIWQV